MTLINPELHIIDKTYENEDVFSNIVTYAFRLNNNQTLPIFCYGIWPPTYKNIIDQLQYIRTSNPTKIDKAVWQLILSFPDKHISDQKFRLANMIAKTFASEYQIFYSCHTDTKHLHFHFFVSTTSFLINNTPLIKEKMDSYIKFIQDMTKDYGIHLIINWKAGE